MVEHFLLYNRSHGQARGNKETDTRSSSEVPEALIADLNIGKPAAIRCHGPIGALRVGVGVGVFAFYPWPSSYQALLSVRPFFCSSPQVFVSSP